MSSFEVDESAFGITGIEIMMFTKTKMIEAGTILNMLNLNDDYREF